MKRPVFTMLKSLNGLIKLATYFLEKGELREPQNKEWHGEGLTVACSWLRKRQIRQARDVRMLRDKYEGAIRIFEREFQRFREEFVEETEKKSRIQQAWQRQRIPHLV